MDRAGLARARLLAAAVDEVLVALAAGLLVAMAVQTGAAAVLAVGLGAVLGPLAPGRAPVAALVAGGLWLAVRLVYGVLAEGGPTAATPGKRLAGLGVAGPGGQACGYARAAVRHAAKTLMIVSLVGLAAALAGRWWHDALAGTQVRPRA